MHQRNISQCTILWQKCAIVCTFLLQSGALWEMALVNCGISAPGLFLYVISCNFTCFLHVTVHWIREVLFISLLNLICLKSFCYNTQQNNHAHTYTWVGINVKRLQVVNFRYFSQWKYQLPLTLIYIYVPIGIKGGYSLGIYVYVVLI